MQVDRRPAPDVSLFADEIGVILLGLLVDLSRLSSIERRFFLGHDPQVYRQGQADGGRNR
ncbi:hypothetical protein D3C73_1388530 [compost metagenome]